MKLHKTAVAFSLIMLFCLAGQRLQAQTPGSGEKAKPRSIADLFEKTMKDSGIKAAIGQYQSLHRDSLEAYNFSEDELNLLGYRLMPNDISAAVDVLKFNLSLFPDSWNAYDSMGEAYLNAGNRDLAIKNYTRSLALNPDNKYGERALDKLLYKSIAETLTAIADAKGAAAAAGFYKDLYRRKPKVYNFKGYVLDNLGHRLLGRLKFEDALMIFRLNAEMHPRSYENYISLGEVHILTGDTTAAVQCFDSAAAVRHSDVIAESMLRMFRPVQPGDITIPGLQPPLEHLSIEEGSCGEACLSTVFKAHGLDLPQLLLNRAGGNPGRGLHTNELFDALDKYGIKYAARSQKDVKDYEKYLKDNVIDPVASGNPVLLGVKIYPDQYPQWSCDHFILIVGYNPGTRELIFNDFSARRRIAIAKLMDTTEGYSVINSRGRPFAIEFPKVTIK